MEIPGDLPSPSAPSRLAPNHSQRPHLTAAILAGGVGFVAVTVLALWMRPDGGGMDSEVVAGLHEHARSNPGIAAVASAVTMIGSAWAIGAIAAVVGVLLALRQRLDLLGCWLVGLAGAGVLRETLKQLAHRPRPVFPDPLVVESSMSFPSGHALGSVVCFGLLAYFVWLAGRSWWNGMAAAGCVVVLASAVGWSRLYIGAHYPTDVLAGYAAGLGWLAVCLGVCEAFRRRRQERGGMAGSDGESREGIA